MARYNQRRIRNYLRTANSGAASTAEKGRAFEDLICYLFEIIPGVEITQRNEMNVFDTEEIDVAVWNNGKSNGLHFLPNIILAECKNWAAPVSSIEVNWFASKLESRGRDFGILVANNGITGNAADLTAAHAIVARHLENGRQIILITKNDIEGLETTQDFIRLIKERLCRLVVTGNVA
jgi:hypothetical protein